MVILDGDGSEARRLTTGKYARLATDQQLSSVMDAPYGG